MKLSSMRHLFSRPGTTIRNGNKPARKSKGQSPRRLHVEQLEERSLLAAVVFMNDNWAVTTDQGVIGVLDAGDTVSNLNDTIAPGTITASYGNTGFGRATSGVIVGTNPLFDNIQEAVTATDVGGTLNVLEGAYAESVIIDKTMQFRGARAGIDAVGRSGVESTITPAGLETTALVYVTAPNVTVNGFTIDGEGAGVLLLDGATTSSAARGIAVDGDNAQVLNNRVENVYRRGVQFGINVSPVGGLVNQNDFNLIGANVATPADSGDAILVFSDVSATNNEITNARNGISYMQVYAPNVTPIVVSGNDINVREIGIGFNEMSSSLPVITVTGNTVVTGDNGLGLLLWSIGKPNGLTTSANTFTGTGVGDVGVYGWVGTAALPMDVTLTGGSISGYATGVLLANNELRYATVPGVAPENAALTLSGVAISVPASGMGVQVQDTLGTHTVTVTVTDDTEISGTTRTSTGVLVSGILATGVVDDAEIHGHDIGIDVDAGFANIVNSRIYDNNTGIRLRNGGTATINGNNFEGGANPDNGTDIRLDPTAGNVTGGTVTGNTFSGTTYFIDNQSPQDLTALATANTYKTANLVETNNFAIEDRIFHQVDSPTSGLVTFVPGTIFVTPNSGTIQQAVNAASPGDTVSVAPGTYVENVIVNKPLTIDGTGGNAGDVILAPVGGTGFTITSNDVTISDLRITGANNALVAANVTPLALKNLQIDGNTNGGTITNVPTFNFTASPGVDTINANGSSLSVTGAQPVQALALTGVTTQNINGSSGSDVFKIIPSATTTFNIDGDLPTPPATPGDRLIVDTAGTTNPTLNSTSTPSGRTGNYTFTNRLPVNFQEIETLGPGVAAGAQGSAVLVADPASSGQNVLLVTGTAGRDRIIIDLVSGGTEIRVRIIMPGPDLNQRFPAASVNKIAVFSLEGNDSITVSSRIFLTAELNGGGGNDYIRSGSGDDLLRGGEGKDYILGGKGDDLLLGEGGNDRLIGQNGLDILIGGVGRDILSGSLGENVLIGGTTAFDDNDAALRTLMDEWHRNAGSFQERTDRLSALLFPPVNVKDDGEVDTLYSYSTVSDWFLDFQLADKRRHVRGSDRLN